MSTATNETMHREHLEWLNDRRMWRDDIRAWQHELKNALAVVDRLTNALRAHEKMLRHHAGVIRLNEQLPAAHEHVLMHQEHGYPGRYMAPTDAQHRREAATHEELKLAHELTKQRLRAVIAGWNRLLRALEADGPSVLQACPAEEVGTK